MTINYKYSETEKVGGNGGNPFKIQLKEDAVKKLTIFFDKNCIRGIEILSAKDELTLKGSKTDKYQSISFQSDETITSLVVYKNHYRNGRCSGISLRTNKNKTLYIPPIGDSESHSLNGGKLVGILGNSGSDIDSLGFIYTLDIISYKLKNVSYDLSKLETAVAPQIVAKITFINKSDITQKGSHTESKTVTKTSSWSCSLGVKVGVKASGEAGVPLLAKGKWEISTEVSFAYTFGESVSETTTYNFTTNLDIPAHSKITCENILNEGKISLPYKGTAVLEFEDGSSLELPESGIYKGIGSFESSSVILPPEPILGSPKNQNIEVFSNNQETPEKIIILEDDLVQV